MLKSKKDYLSYLEALFTSEYQYVTITYEKDEKLFQLFSCYRWLINKQAKRTLICLCEKKHENNSDNSKGFLDALHYIEKKYDFKPENVLVIYVGKYVIDCKEQEYDCVSLFYNYLSGFDIYKEFPTINEISKSAIPEFIKGKTKFSMHDFSKTDIFLIKYTLNFFTKLFMFLSICISLITMYLGNKYSSSSAQIFMGGDYLTFTLGLKQFYRLITSSFIHGGTIHLVMNMYSLYNIGSLVETEFGHLKFLFTMLISILLGSLTSDILNGNQLIIGISGGLYGLMTFYMCYLYFCKNFHVPYLYPVIIINLVMNFLPNVAWQVHVGGAVAGYLCYNIFNSDKTNRMSSSILLATVLIVLVLKYLSINEISPFYGGTDIEVINMIQKYISKDYGQELYIRLLEVYKKFGG